MIIQAYRPQNLKAVIDLWTESGLIARQNDPHQDIQRKMLVDADLFLVGIKGAEVIASVMGGYEGHRGWINYLAVRPSLRRQGYARLMMVHIESLLEAKGCPKVNLQIREENKDVMAFYAALGYVKDRVVSLGKRIT